MPGTVMYPIHHMMAVKNAVPASQLTRKARTWDFDSRTPSSHGVRPTHASQ